MRFFCHSVGKKGLTCLLSSPISRSFNYIEYLSEMECQMKIQREFWMFSLVIIAMVVGVLWVSNRTESDVEQAVNGNFAAASFLSHLQLEGERLRRYEKEMFIYVANTEKRAEYVKEFNDTYNKVLGFLDAMLKPSAKVFSEEEQKEILAWKQAAIFYRNEFYALSEKAQAIPLLSLTTEQRLGLTVEYNEGIKAGKNRFRELLLGTAKMRATKQESAQTIVTNIRRIFQKLQIGVVFGGGALIGMAVYILRQKRRSSDGKLAPST
jgi:hypothetical protein